MPDTGSLSRLTSAALAAAICAHAGETQARPGIAGCEVITPTGAYELATLQFTFTGVPRDTPPLAYIGGIRDGKMPMSDGVGLREPGGTLTRAGGKLTGAFRRISLTYVDRMPVPGGEITVDATIAADGTVSGSANLPGRQGTVAGRIIPEAQLAAGNAIPKEAAWPSFLGPIGGGVSAVPSGQSTIEAVSDIRPVWRCEEIDIGRGMGNINRFMIQWRSASTIRSGSGCASPLLADGRIYMKYFVPAPRDAQTPMAPALPAYRLSEAAAAEAMLQEAKKAGFEDVPMYALEKTMQSADDVVLCMDAATGKTIWKAVVKSRAVNYQHHKAGPFNLSPAISGNRIFAPSTSGWVYAFDAGSGKPLWEVQAGYDDSNALLAVGDVLIAPAGAGWGGYDAATGKRLWTYGNGRPMATWAVWQHGGTTYLIGIAGAPLARDGVACLDAATGKEVWKLPINVVTGGRGRGPGGITIVGDRMVVYQDNGTGKKNEKIVPALAVYALKPTGAELAWQLAGPAAQAGEQTDGAKEKEAKDGAEGKAEEGGEDLGGANMGVAHLENVPVVVHGAYIFTPGRQTVDLATGKVISQAQGPFPHNGGYMQAMDDLVLVRVDGTHGGISCGWYKVDKQGNIRSLTPDPKAAWFPTISNGTTSYHHPIFYPMGAGRMFLRHADGIYCWDLRPPTP